MVSQATHESLESLRVGEKRENTLCLRSSIGLCPMKLVAELLCLLCFVGSSKTWWFPLSSVKIHGDREGRFGATEVFDKFAWKISGNGSFRTPLVVV